MCGGAGEGGAVEDLERLVPGCSQALACALQPFLAARRQGFPALPQGKGFLKAGPACLKPSHYGEELLAGFLVAKGRDVGPGLFFCHAFSSTSW